MNPPVSAVSPDQVKCRAGGLFFAVKSKHGETKMEDELRYAAELERLGNLLMEDCDDEIINLSEALA